MLGDVDKRRRGMAISNQLATARDMLGKIETTLGKLYEQTAQTASFGDQSRTLASIRDLEASRDRWRQEIAQLEAQAAGKSRKIKVYFPPC